MTLAKFVHFPKGVLPCSGAIAVAPCRSALAALFLAGPCQDRLPGAHWGKGSPYHTFLECTAAYRSTATLHQRDICCTVSPGAALGVQVPWGHQRREADNVGVSEGLLLQKFFPTDGRARIWVHRSQRPHSRHDLDCLLQPLHWYSEHCPLCLPSLLGPEYRARKVLKQGAWSGGFPAQRAVCIPYNRGDSPVRWLEPVALGVG